MTCPRCQHENPAGSSFCLECGARLGLRCGSCGTDLPAGSRFCNQCGTPVSSSTAERARFSSPQSYTPKHLAEKILTSRGALEGERKQVTVLFADMKGSMELLADRDPEEARKVLDPVLERMMEAVHRYEGTVNQVMGDGIMALFGAPLAHEDHAVRACYAALRMHGDVRRYAEDLRRAQGLDVQIRVGLDSGAVVVRAIGSDLHMDYTAVGQTTHLAARMEQLARPGGTLMTGDTLRLCEGYVQVNPLGPTPVKGLGAPVEVYELVGAGAARTRFQAAAARGLTRFVGRDAELEQLRRAQQLAGGGDGQVVAIVGEAGVGKSRLTYEFTHSHWGQGWLILESSSVSYGRATSYLPVIDLLKGYFKIGDRDDHREMRAKVLGRVLGLDRALEPLLPPLLALLDVPIEDAAWQSLDPPRRRQCTLDAVKRLLLRESQGQPLLVVFEDLHWIDGETQALLDGLVDSLGSARLLLLVTYRPGYEHGWGSKTAYSQLRLDALPAQSAAEFLEALLGEDAGLAPLKQLLVKRGNPFFLEETVRTLAETTALTGERGRYRLTQPLHTIQVPPTVHAMLAARIDRLHPEDKRLLQVASVIGKDVPFGLLQAIADQPDEGLHRGLDHLRAAEFLYETGLYPDLAYTFQHALTHEVTYGSLLHERRRELHARIVTAIETLHGDRLGEQIERLAHHALRGELGGRAVGYLRQAGRKAAGRSALPDAQSWFEQALGVLGTLPESPAMLAEGVDLRLALRLVLGWIGEARQALERLREAESLAARLHDDRRRGRVYLTVATTHANLGELDEALVAGTRALEIADRLGDLRLRLPATTYLAQTHFFRGDYERAVLLATENLAALPADWTGEFFELPAPLPVYDLTYLILSLTSLGRFAPAAEHATYAIRLAEPMQHAFTVGFTYFAAGGGLHLTKGDLRTACSMLDHASTVLRTGNVLLLLPMALARCAWGLAQRGHAPEALTRIREAEPLVERLAAQGNRLEVAVTDIALGHAWLLLGRLDAARRLGECALDSSPSFDGYAAEAQCLLGDIATHLERFDAERGEAHYRKALALAEPRGMRPLVAHCHLGLGRLYTRTGERAQAQEHRTTATTMYRAMGMTYWLEQAEAETKDNRASC